ncbi:ABC transporter ATP-binding protein [Rhodococcus erythropolis]|uniref:ABC transporter ATP-binding protein n=1 Tax=Rhodococcus erythropolis TaxID=1833 RepID=UPI000878D60F|nr:ABC transporter ATP-binding protein [Rhodococcus erythropolis]OFV73855.1 bicarbonate transport ATP-binding protein CmpC [Rhodococcus erythropolis]
MKLRADAVSKTYGSGSTARLAIEPTTVSIGEEEFVTIVGPSGCGKSTFLMMMAGLLEPSGGQVLLGDQPVDGPPFGLSVVFQDYSRSLFPWMNVRRNLSMAASAYRLPKVELAERVEHALESVGLAGQGDIYPWQMSGGMQQRVAIARALVVEPKVMLMDEPFAAVDAQTRADLEDLVLTVRNEYKVTVAFVTHDIDEAVYLGDRVLVLAAGPGRMIADIPVALGRPRHQVETKLDPRFAELRSQVYQLVMRPSSQRPTAEATQ